MKQLFLLPAFLCLFGVAMAQKSGSVSGILADSADRSALQYATVSLYKAGDSVLTTYKLTDTKGFFQFTKLEINTAYRLVINAWQYEVLRKEFSLTTDRPNVVLDTLKLSKKSNELDEVVIIAERPPVIVRKDTIEFNAEAFKTLPTAVVEDLLKKLPGVSLGEDGQFQVNGKNVSKILVDGKEFFGGDQQIATKNLPANIIDKVQVTVDKEALQRDPELTEANTPQVINLKLKKAMKKGAFGKVYAGGGLNERYETGGILNIFRDTTQISVLGYGNNLNKSGFSIGDIQRIGGFSRSGVNMMMVSANGGFALNGVSFGGTGSGVQTSGGGGANFNTLSKKGLKVNGQYFFGQINSDLNRLTNNNQTLGEGSLISNSNLVDLRKNFSHRLSGKLEWKPNSLSTIIFNPGISLSSMTSDWSQTSESRNHSGNLINSSDNMQQQEGSSLAFDIRSSLNRDFKKKGRSLNAGLNVNRGQNDEDNLNQAVNTFYTSFTPGGTAGILDQLRITKLQNLNAGFYANYSEPFSKKLSLRTSANINYLDNENALYTFYRGEGQQNYDVAVPEFSETVNQSGWKNNLNLRLSWKPVKDLGITPGLVYNFISLHNSFVKYADFQQRYDFLFPSLALSYKKVNINYNPSFREPDIRVIQPIENNTDPLFIQKGNPSLLPAKSHNIYASVQHYDVKKSLNYSLYLGGDIKDNGVVNSRSVDANGVQTSTPVNADGIWSFYTNGSLRKEFKSAKRQISISAGYYLDFSRGVLMVNSQQSASELFTVGPNAAIRLNLNDKIELNQRYQPAINNSSYEDPFFRDMKVLTHRTETELILRYPKKVVWETSLNLSANTGQLAGYSNNINLWNAAVTYLFMKNDRAQLKLSVNDILESNVSRYRSIQQNYITDVQSNSLGRFALLSLTYNIQNFGGKVGGKERFFGF